jgi:hypothetical protein
MLAVITQRMPYAMEVCAVTPYAGPTGPNAATRSEGLFSVSSKPRACLLLLDAPFSRHQHADSHMCGCLFSPGMEGGRFSSSWLARTRIAKSEVGYQVTEWRW